MRIDTGPAAAGVTVTPKMPGLDGSSVANVSVRAPVRVTMARPEVSGLNVRRSVKWMAKRAARPTTSTGCSTKSSVCAVQSLSSRTPYSYGPWLTVGTVW